MAINLSDNILARTTAPLDAKYGPYSGATLNDAKNAAFAYLVASYRYEGLTVGLKVGSNDVVEYWFLGGVANGNLVLKTTGSGTSSTNISFEETTTIGYTQSGSTYSFFVKEGSLTASVLNTGGGAATAGYVLSSDVNGEFKWVQPTSGGSGPTISVIDFNTGTTFSGVENIIFRGGVITTPTGTATSTLVTGPAPTVIVWIPAPNYVGYFAPSLGSGSARYIAQPTSNTYNSTPGNSGQYGIGTWLPSTNFTNNTSRLTINSSSPYTAFSATDFACFNTGTTMSFTLYNYDGSILSQINNFVINGSGSTSSNGITLTVSTFSANADRYKASAFGTIDIGTLFPNGGKFNWNITHYNGEGPGNGSSGVYSYTSGEIFYDSDGSSSSANISGGVVFDELTPITVTYSGVAFYKIGTQFSLTASGVNLLNEITFPLSKQIDFTCTALAVAGSLDGYADGTKGVGTQITGWTIDWNNTGLTFSRTATVNSSSVYIPDFSTNNTISNTPISYVRSTIYDWSTVGFSQSSSKAMLFDTYTPTSVTFAENRLDSENGRLSVSGVLTNGSSPFDSSLSLSTTNTDELQYIFGRVIFPQTDFTSFYPTPNFSASVNYSSLTGANKTFAVYTNLAGSGVTTPVSFNDYRWHVTSYGLDAAYSIGIPNGVFTIYSNFSESILHYDGVNSTAGTGELVILVGIDDTSANATPNKFLFVSGDPNVYQTRTNSLTYNFNKGGAFDSSKNIQFSKGTLSAVVRKVWLFVGYKNTATGKNLKMVNISFGAS